MTNFPITPHNYAIVNYAIEQNTTIGFHIGQLSVENTRRIVL